MSHCVLLYACSGFVYQIEMTAHAYRYIMYLRKSYSTGGYLMLNDLYEYQLIGMYITIVSLGCLYRNGYT